MKKVKINRENLPYCPASLRFGAEPKIIKLSMPQAMFFKSQFTSFEEMLGVYGAQKQLKLGENYNGYVAVFIACWKQEVVYLNGEIHREDNGRYSVYRDVCYRKGFGYFEKVYNFNECDFATWLKFLQLHGKLDQTIDPQNFSQKLKDKLIDAVINSRMLSLTDEEYLTLLSYDLKNFTKIFEEVNN